MLNKLKSKSEFNCNVLTFMTGTTDALALEIGVSPDAAKQHLVKLQQENKLKRVGSGIGRIKKFCKEHNIIEPKFEEMQKGFQVTLYKAIVSEKKLNVGASEGVNEGVKSLCELVAKKPNHRSTFFAKELHTSVKNIERWLKQLKDKKKIEFIGASKTGGCYVK